MRSSTRVGMAMVGVFALAYVLTMPAMGDGSYVVSPYAKLRADLADVVDQVGQDELIPISIVLVDQAPREEVEAIKLLNSKSKQREALRTLLQGVADRSQGPIIDLIQQRQQVGQASGKLRALWIHNVIVTEAIADVVFELALRDDVAYINYDKKLGRELFPAFEADPPNVAALECGVEQMDAHLVWDELGYTGEGVVVGIIDTGVCRTHPDLKKQIWRNPGELIDGMIVVNGIDDDNNGYVDDFIGWNFENNNNNTDDIDFSGHGTHTCGTVSGDGTNGTQTGMAPDVGMMILRYWNSFAGEANSWEALEYGSMMAADAITASNGWPHSQNPDRSTWRMVVENVIAGGTVVVYAAGNEQFTPPPDSVRTPGDVPMVITAGAVDCNDNLANFSSVGPVEWENVAPYFDFPLPPGKTKPTAMAPGVNTISTSNNCTGYNTLSGTSMSTPHMAGAIALALEANPYLQHEEMKELIIASSADLGPPGFDNTYGAGSLNAKVLVENALAEICCNGGGECMDLDGVPGVGLGDASQLAGCVTGPDAIPDGACQCADVDVDIDVDLRDVAEMFNAFGI